MLDVRGMPAAFHEPALCTSLSTGALCCCTRGREVGAPVEPSDTLAPAQEGRVGRAAVQHWLCLNAGIDRAGATNIWQLAGLKTFGTALSPLPSVS